MSWQPPNLPGNSLRERVEYWTAILEIPEDEPGAPHLRRMAAQRLEELGAPSSEQIEAA